MNTFYNTTDQHFHIDPVEVYDLHKCVWRLVCNSSWLGTFTIAFILFILLSTRRQRRSILFSIQCGLFILAIGYNSSALANADLRFKMAWIKQEDRQKYWSIARLDVANLSLEHWITILADGSLLFHIIPTFFPSKHFNKQQRLICLLPFLIIMMARVALTLANSYFSWMSEKEIEWVPNRSIPLPSGTRWTDVMDNTAKAEYILAGIYSIVISAFLLFKSYTILEAKSKMDNEFSGPVYPISIALKSAKMTQEAVLMCYTLPIVFRFVVVGLLDCPSKYCYDREISLTIINTSVICSIFATTWSTIRPIRSKDEIEKDRENGQQDMNPAYKSFAFSGGDVQENSNADTLVN